jgi:hypothetical protein
MKLCTQLVCYYETSVASHSCTLSSLFNNDTVRPLLGGVRKLQLKKKPKGVGKNDRSIKHTTPDKKL